MQNRQSRCSRGYSCETDTCVSHEIVCWKTIVDNGQGVLFEQTRSIVLDVMKMDGMLVV